MPVGDPYRAWNFDFCERPTDRQTDITGRRSRRVRDRGRTIPDPGGPASIASREWSGRPGELTDRVPE